MVAVRCGRRYQADLGMTHKLDDTKSIFNSGYSRFSERVDNLGLIEAKTVLEQLVVDREN